MLLGYLKPHFAVAGSKNGPSWASSWHLPVAGYTHAYTCGEVLIRQGDVGDAFYTVEEGAFDIFVKMRNNKSGHGKKVATAGAEQDRNSQWCSSRSTLQGRACEPLCGL